MRVLKVVDTREYEEIGDRWVPIPGSGNPRPCDRCGRPHEVHATVKMPSGETMVVGTGCMGMGPEAGRKVASRAGTIAKLEAEIKKKTALYERRRSAEAEVAKMKPPEPVWMLDRTPPRVSVGGTEMWIQHRTEAESLRDAIHFWRQQVLAELGGTTYPASYVASEIRDIDLRLKRAQAALGKL